MTSKTKFKEFIERNYPELEIDTFVFTTTETRGGRQVNARSKYEGVNCSIYITDENWETAATTHINWQLGKR